MVHKVAGDTVGVQWIRASKNWDHKKDHWLRRQVLGILDKLNIGFLKAINSECRQVGVESTEAIKNEVG